MGPKNLIKVKFFNVEFFVCTFCAGFWLLWKLPICQIFNAMPGCTGILKVPLNFTYHQPYFVIFNFWLHILYICIFKMCRFFDFFKADGHILFVQCYARVQLSGILKVPLLKLTDIHIVKNDNFSVLCRVQNADVIKHPEFIKYPFHFSMLFHPFIIL